MTKNTTEELNHARFLKDVLKFFNTGRLFFIVEKHRIKEIKIVVYDTKKLRDEKYAQLRYILSTDVAKEEIEKIRFELNIPPADRRRDFYQREKRASNKNCPDERKFETYGNQS